MKPTIGRIVLYKAGDGNDLPAIVVKVWNDTCVNLKVFTNDAEQALFVTSVTEGDQRGSWRWPTVVARQS